MCEPNHMHTQVKNKEKNKIFNGIQQSIWSLSPHNTSIVNNPLINHKNIKLMNKLLLNGWKQHSLLAFLEH